MPITEPYRPETQPPNWQDQSARAQRDMWTSIHLAPDRSELIQATYRYLIIACVAALAGGWVGSHWMPWIKFMVSTVGFIIMLVVINVLPNLALAAARSNPMTATLALAGHGFVSGMVLAPMLFVATLMSKGMVGPSLIDQALVITAVVFAAVTGYIMLSKKSFSPPRGLMTGIFFAIAGAIVMNLFFLNSLLATVIVAGIGIFGVLTLIYSTSTVLNDPEYDNPVYGALSLFAGLFMVFQFVLRILMMFAGGGRRD